MGEISLKHVDGVALITIENEPLRNAITGPMAVDLLDAFLAAEADKNVGAVVVTGAGDRAFCSGHNLKEALAHRESLYDAVQNRCFTVPTELTKPVLAAINGPAYAGGLVLALSADLRFCSPNAVFVASAVKLGLVPIGGQLVRLPQLLPPSLALEMLLLARPLEATEAGKLHFVSAVVEQEELLPLVMGRAREVAALSEKAVTGIKGAWIATLTGGPPAGQLMEQASAKIAGESWQVEEGIAAFLEKRAPNFRQAHRS